MTVYNTKVTQQNKIIDKILPVDAYTMVAAYPKAQCLTEASSVLLKWLNRLSWFWHRVPTAYPTTCYNAIVVCPK